MLKQVLFALTAVIVLAACNDNSISLNADEHEAWSAVFDNPNDHALEVRLFNQGKQIGDAAIQFDALHAMLAREPHNLAVKDSMAVLYFQTRMYGQALRLSSDLIESAPQDPRYLEMRAVSQNSLGLLEDALSSYEALLAVDPNPYYGYQIATLQYGLNRFDLAEASVDNMLAGDLSAERVNINIADGRSQTVPMKAALLNIKGVLRKDVHADFDQAAQYFQLAMAEAPDFLLANNNLAALQRATAN